jgi:hypothetical protein
MMTYQYDLQTEAIISAGFKLLSENLGTVETEIFLLNVNRAGFDYSKWREEQYADMTLGQILDYASEKASLYTPPQDIQVI